MFRLDESQDYLWPCTIHFPKSGGGWRTIPFKARFKRLSKSEIQSITEGGSGDDDSFLAEAFLGFEGLRDHKGEIVEDTPENREQLLDMPEARGALVRGFFESLAGKQGRRGN